MPLAVAFSQQQGFFNLYDYGVKSMCASFVTETESGSFIVATYDYNNGPGELVKLSDDGTFQKRVSISDENTISFVDGIYIDPSAQGWYYAIGYICKSNKSDCKPYVMRFDEDLSISEQIEVDLPSVYSCFNMTRAIMTDAGDILYAASLDAQHSYHRLYMRIALDGTLTKFYEETNGCGKGIMINAIFEFPQGDFFGDYRSSFLQGGDPTLCMRLFGFDDSFVFDTIHQYEAIIQIVGDTVYSISHFNSANGTVLLVNDTTLLFSERAQETWCNPAWTFFYDRDRSTILFSTDMSGDIRDYLVIGSRNDTVDVPIAFNAIDMAKYDDLSVESVYHGCYCSSGIIPGYSPYNLVLTKLDPQLNIKWQHSYTHPSKFLQATYLIATNDGGCMVVGGAYKDGHFDLFALKVNSDGYVGTDEITITEEFCIFPNPVKDVLHILAPEMPKGIELYDLQGRLVRKQNRSLEQIDLQGLTPGQYLMKVTMKDGKTYTDKVVKE